LTSFLASRAAFFAMRVPRNERSRFGAPPAELSQERSVSLARGYRVLTPI
jgi:hypothetical protein